MQFFRGARAATEPADAEELRRPFPPKAGSDAEMVGGAVDLLCVPRSWWVFTVGGRSFIFHGGSSGYRGGGPLQYWLRHGCWSCFGIKCREHAGQVAGQVQRVLSQKNPRFNRHIWTHPQVLLPSCERRFKRTSNAGRSEAAPEKPRGLYSEALPAQNSPAPHLEALRRRLGGGARRVMRGPLPNVAVPQRRCCGQRMTKDNWT